MYNTRIKIMYTAASKLCTIQYPNHVQYCIKIMYTPASKLCTCCVQIMYVPVMLSQRIRLVMIFPQEENNLSRSAETYKIKNSRQTFFKGVVILVMVQVSICRINLNKKLVCDKDFLHLFFGL